MIFHVQTTAGWIFRLATMAALCAVCAVSIARANGAAPKSFPVAMRTYGIWLPDADKRFDVAVWYPGGSGEGETRMDGWRIPATHNSRIIPGSYGVILLSHDTAGSRFANHDLAVALAANGFVVIAPTHMGDNQSNSSLLYTARLLYNRPRELLQAMETVLSAPELGGSLDATRTGLLGAGFGAITAMQLAGAAPDAQALAGFCSSTRSKDIFCASWSGERLSKLPTELAALEKRYGSAFLTPPFSLPSPAMKSAQSSERHAIPNTGKETPPSSPFSLLFHKNISISGDYGSQSRRDGDAPAAIAQPIFQGGKLFGGTGTGSPFVDIFMPMAPPPSAAASPAGEDSYNRPHQPMRLQLRAAALMAPAGGMLFSRQELARVKVPTAVVEAENDELYPLREHSRPYHDNLPVQPRSLRIAGSDHFSLFAPCSPALATSLGKDACGRAEGKMRRQLAALRNNFLVSFFFSTLGPPLPPQTLEKSRKKEEQAAPEAPLQPPQTQAGN